MSRLPRVRAAGCCVAATLGGMGRWMLALEARKPDPQWVGKQGRGFAPVQKPLRLPGKGRGG